MTAEKSILSVVEITLKINSIVTTEYITLAQKQHSIFIIHYFNAKLLGKYSQTPVWKLCDSCQIRDRTNFQNNLSWPNSNTAGISLDYRLQYSKITHRYAKKPIHLVLVMITSHWSMLSVNFTSPVA